MTSRIKEIKKRWSRVPGELDWFTPTTLKEKQKIDVERSWSDIQFLLAKLEQADKALEELHRYTAPDYPFNSTGTIAEFHTLTNVALKAIRE